MISDNAFKGAEAVKGGAYTRRGLLAGVLLTRGNSRMIVPPSRCQYRSSIDVSRSLIREVYYPLVRSHRAGNSSVAFSAVMINPDNWTGPKAMGTVCAVDSDPALAALEAQSPASSSVARPPALAVRRRKSASTSSSVSPYPAQISSIEAFIPE